MGKFCIKSVKTVSIMILMIIFFILVMELADGEEVLGILEVMGYGIGVLALVYIIILNGLSREYYSEIKGIALFIKDPKNDSDVVKLLREKLELVNNSIFGKFLIRANAFKKGEFDLCVVYCVDHDKSIYLLHIDAETKVYDISKITKISLVRDLIRGRFLCLIDKSKSNKEIKNTIEDLLRLSYKGNVESYDFISMKVSEVIDTLESENIIRLIDESVALTELTKLENI